MASGQKLIVNQIANDLVHERGSKFGGKEREHEKILSYLHLDASWWPKSREEKVVCGKQVSRL